MTYFGSVAAYRSPFHEYGTPMAFDLIRAVADAALIAAMEEAGVPREYRLRLLNRFGGRLLASEINPACRDAQ